ncbi:tellurite resistance TehB family protein, partial [Vibrio parahaemolyticus V-223/04]
RKLPLTLAAVQGETPVFFSHKAFVCTHSTTTLMQ